MNPSPMQFSHSAARVAAHEVAASAAPRNAVIQNLSIKWIVPAILLLSSTAAPAGIICQEGPGYERGVHWSWRDIDGRRCWFKQVGTIPPKSELRWEKPKAERPKLRPVPVEQPVPDIRVLKTRIEWEGFSEVEANWIDGDAPVDLMRPESISGPSGVGGSWVVPSHAENSDESMTFATRFAPVIESRKPRAAVP